MKCQNLPLPPLPYDYDALEPVISSDIMKLHHLRHHQGYADKLNAALSTLRTDPETKYLAKLGVDSLLRSKLEEVPVSLRGTIRNNGGGYVNHGLFWNSMQPPSETVKMPSLIEREINKAFGSLKSFQHSFTKAGMGVFGSGWVFLIYDGVRQSLTIETTANQDIPKGFPILALDVWEHAYYLQYQNRRLEYIEKWFEVVNWSHASELLETVVSGAKEEL